MGSISTRIDTDYSYLVKPRQIKEYSIIFKNKYVHNYFFVIQYYKISYLERVYVYVQKNIMYYIFFVSFVYVKLLLF